MKQLEAVRLALVELGPASDAEVSAFIRERHGLAVEPKFLPILRAMLKERELLESFRQRRTESTALA